MAGAGNGDVFGLPASPSVTKIRDMLMEKNGPGPGSLLDSNLQHHFPQLPPRSSQDHDVDNMVRNTNRDHLLGAREKSANSQSSVESVQLSGPLDTGVYKRFNG